MSHIVQELHQMNQCESNKKSCIESEKIQILFRKRCVEDTVTL